MLQSRSETHIGPNGASVEVGTITFEGKEFSALGSCIDEENGIIHAYASGIPGAYKLTTFAGNTLADLKLVSMFYNRRCFGGFPVKMYAWRCVYNGKTYSGRNGGPCMLVRMRASKKGV